MTGLRHAGAALAILAVGAVPGRVRVAPASPRIAVELIPPSTDDTLASITPTFSIRATDIAPEDRPIMLGLQVSRTPGFTDPLLVDMAVPADSAEITPPNPLPSGETLYFRATVTTTLRERVASPPVRREVPQWLVLISPNEPNGSTLETRRPRFTWSSPEVSDPPGPWRYDLVVRNVGSGREISVGNLADTTVILLVPLDFNTSYRWSVTARLTTGASINVASLSSFVIVDPGVPQSTLLYQNFPNPFPSATSEFTCVWFDLATISPVRLEVFDLRGRPVRTLLPESGEFAFLNPGRHGRTVGPGGGTGCNGTIRWDGRGRDGAIVPAGVYLLRLRAEGINLTRRVVFLGGM